MNKQFWLESTAGLMVLLLVIALLLVPLLGVVDDTVLVGAGFVIGVAVSAGRRWVARWLATGGSFWA